MAEPTLTSFGDESEFLRRIRLANQINKNLLIHWRAFHDRDARMSLTFRDEDLMSDRGVDAYQAYWSERVGATIPAILRFTFIGLVRYIDPSLEPTHDPVADDPRYGHLHCSTNAPRDKEHMQMLAKLVNDGVYAGIARYYFKRVA